ncbi:unnamed protein product [Brachionus calyciflorus]|uniref:Uncharacterized protein n=1 Tax=Brachionus calyciflorus TaxID=104777 RepID=A0A814NAG1_9BILA|nr:unnamed protein product [Brachionus calyciflorus]
MSGLVTSLILTCFANCQLTIENTLCYNGKGNTRIDMEILPNCTEAHNFDSKVLILENFLFDKKTHDLYDFNFLNLSFDSIRIKQTTLKTLVNISELYNLKILEISNSELIELENDDLLPDSLEQLIFKNNKIFIIKQNFFEKFTKLSLIDLRFNELTYLNNFVFNSNFLKLIDLKKNKLNFVGFNFQNEFTDKEFLIDLSENDLVRLFRILGKLKIVNCLSLGYRTTNDYLNKSLIENIRISNMTIIRKLMLDYKIVDNGLSDKFAEFVRLNRKYIQMISYYGDWLDIANVSRNFKEKNQIVLIKGNIPILGKRLLFQLLVTELVKYLENLKNWYRVRDEL